jgi:hypothetical protein
LRGFESGFSATIEAHLTVYEIEDVNRTEYALSEAVNLYLSEILGQPAPERTTDVRFRARVCFDAGETADVVEEPLKVRFT